MSDGFSAGLAARTVDVGAIGRIMAGMGAFAATAPGGRPDEGAAPRHFTPASPGTNPTAGWDMFDAGAPAHPSTPAPDRHEQAVEAARAEGYALGLTAGEAAAKAAHAADAEALALIAAGLQRLQPFDRTQLAGRLSRTVLHLTAELVGEAGIAPDRLLARVEAAAGLIADATGSTILRLNPEDLKLVDGQVPEPLFAIADPSLPRGSIRLESRDAVVEDGPELWLAQLASALDGVTLPC